MPRHDIMRITRMLLRAVPLLLALAPPRVTWAQRAESTDSRTKARSQIRPNSRVSTSTRSRQRQIAGSRRMCWQTRPMSAASSLTVREQDLRLRPMQRVGDLLRVAPGLITVQHAGGGKANQYLSAWLRCRSRHRHRADARWNSHQHGVARTRSRVRRHQLDHSRADRTNRGGQRVRTLASSATSPPQAPSIWSPRADSKRTLSRCKGACLTPSALSLAAGPTFGKLRTLMVGEGGYSNGPFENPERFKKYNLFAKLTYDSVAQRSSISIAVSSYGGDWYASGQLPLREVDAGRLGFFGNIDPTEGGNSARQNLSLSYQVRDDKNEADGAWPSSRATPSRCCQTSPCFRVIRSTAMASSRDR
jgi:hypothetical protein